MSTKTRTDNCIHAAMEYAAKTQESVVLVAADHGQASTILDRIAALDPAGHPQRDISNYRLSDGGAIFVTSMKSPVVSIGRLAVRGVKPEAVFWEPSALYEAYGPVIDGFHRYD